jgi:hypothetical protein
MQIQQKIRRYCQQTYQLEKSPNGRSALFPDCEGGRPQAPAAAPGGPVGLAALADMDDAAYDAYVSENGIDVVALLSK